MDQPAVQWQRGQQLLLGQKELTDLVLSSQMTMEDLDCDRVIIAPIDAAPDLGHGTHGN
jgi:hypothetical protein